MKIKITIIGPNVHDVGYRPFLIALAGDCGISKFGVRNIRKDGEQSVVAIVDAEEAQIEGLMDLVGSNKPEGAEVTGIDSELYAGEVPSIMETSIVNMNAQLAKGIKRLDELPGIKANTGAILEEIKGVKEELQPGLTQQMRRDIAAIKERLGMP